MTAAVPPVQVPVLVQRFRLNTSFYSDPKYVKHIYDISEGMPPQRTIRKEEVWRSERPLGSGGNATVELQQCVLGDGRRNLRAVKSIRKVTSRNYYDRELEAIALFSQHEQYFVKSFGWYENSIRIFISMEYFSEGDLDHHLRSPLLENEAQCIVSQILGGLTHMHGHGFAHRDLKPQNILVVRRGPAWWVKIADFGISKREIEGLAQLNSTQVGTPGFQAPEVIESCRTILGSRDSYTNAVNMWSLGVSTFRILTGEMPFNDQRPLEQYVTRENLHFPIHVLLTRQVSANGCAFVRGLMAVDPRYRPSAGDALQSLWLTN